MARMAGGAGLRFGAPVESPEPMPGAWRAGRRHLKPIQERLLRPARRGAPASLPTSPEMVAHSSGRCLAPLAGDPRRRPQGVIRMADDPEVRGHLDGGTVRCRPRGFTEAPIRLVDTRRV